MDPGEKRTLRYNLIVTLLDGGFFGLAIGFASFTTIIPLFVSQFTTTAALIGLVPAIHNVGWQLPQLFIAGRVSRLRRFKPWVVWLTIHERLPFLGFAVVAWLAPHWQPAVSVWIIYLLLIWQGLGSGLAASPWQSMIARIIPSEMRGTFFGAQAASANLLASGSAVLSGILLTRLPAPYDFISCFLLAFAAMIISFLLLTGVREQASEVPAIQLEVASFSQHIKRILSSDKSFRWFLVVRILSQTAVGAFAFYTVYAVRELGVSELTIGVMTAILMGTQIIANPLMGWLGDRFSYRGVMILGIIAAMLSALLAWQGDSASAFYLVFILAGIANVAVWTIGLALTLKFGTDIDRPAYVGLANTLVAPATFLAPLFSGWLADAAGYPITFLVSAGGGLLTLMVLVWLVRDPSPGIADDYSSAPVPAGE